MELSEFDVQYELRGPIKGQVYVDFLVELSSTDAHQEEANFRWVLSVDGSSNQQGSGVGVILDGSNGGIDRAGPTVRILGQQQSRGV